MPERSDTACRRTAFTKALLVACIVALSLLLAGGLAGCRFSDALASLVIDPINGTYEEELDPEYQDADDAEVDETRASTHESDSDNETDQEVTLPVYDATAGENGVAKQRLKQQQSIEEDEATEGDELTDEATDGEAGEGEEDADDTSAGDDEGDGGDDDGQEDEAEAEAEGDGSSEATSTAGRDGEG